MNEGQETGDKGRGKTGSFTPHAPRPTSLASTQRILIIGPSNIGDALLALDVITILRRAYPTAHLTLAVGERAKLLFVDDPRINTLVDMDTFATPMERVQLTLALWRYQPHFLVDLRHTLYPALLKPLQAWRYVLQPSKSVIHMRDRHRWKLRVQVPSVAPWLEQRRASSKRESRTDFPLWVSPKDTAHVDSLWRRWGLDQTPRVVVMCPGARSHIKRWTTQGFARVADRLIVEARAQIVFSGEPDEEPVIEDILGLMEHRAHSAVGLTTVRQLGLLMQRAQLVITNDSASLHLASLLQAPTVAIFGPTDAQKYGPTSPRHRVIRRWLFCTPCEQALCRFNHECMRFIPADEVYEAACQLLEAGGKTLEAGKDTARHV